MLVGTTYCQMIGTSVLMRSQATANISVMYQERLRNLTPPDVYTVRRQTFLTEFDKIKTEGGEPQAHATPPIN